jgi:aminomethyltransferase
MVEFAGWELPLHYGSQLAEHTAVRTRAGLFDVSHMGVVDVSGARAFDFIRYLLANDIGRLSGPGTALYSCMLNPSGGILDDVIAYWVDSDRFRIVVNAATRHRDVAWISEHAHAFGVDVVEREGLAIIALQGPNARDNAASALPWLPRAADMLAPMQFLAVGDRQIARTGYTGEDGYELIVPDAMAVDMWEALIDAGSTACGLGARDSLRLEAGMRLYGNDMDETLSPFDCGLGWTVAVEPLGRDFIGRTGLLARVSGGIRFVGVVLDEPGVLREHQPLRMPDGGEGVLTSGGYSPTLNRSIGFARVPRGSDTTCSVGIRGHWKSCRLLALRFVRHGRPLITL